MKLIILFTFVATSLAVPLSQSLAVNEDGTYQFYYETGKDGGSHSRSEKKGADGVVVGKFSYEDPTGELREVNYKADQSGYVANGDVSVKGAPKGQFPVSPDTAQEAPLQNQDVKNEDSNNEESQNESTPPQPEGSSKDEADSNEEDDVSSNLTLEENVEDGPPEAFPQGFFLEKFQGLRRLPEPIKVDKSTIEAASKIEESKEENSEKEEGMNNKVPVSDEAALPKAFRPFFAFQPFQRPPPQEWGAFMFHEPVYVFSYQQPDSYGYHYFY